MFYISKHHHRYWYNDIKAKVRTLLHTTHCAREWSFQIIFAFLPKWVGRKSGSISRQRTLAASIFKSLFQENPLILRLPEFRQFPYNVQIYGGHTELIEFTEFRKFTENWHPCKKRVRGREWMRDQYIFDNIWKLVFLVWLHVVLSVKTYFPRRRTASSKFFLSIQACTSLVWRWKRATQSVRYQM